MSKIPVDSAPPGGVMHLDHVFIKLLPGAPAGYQKIYVELQGPGGYVMHAVGPADIPVDGSLTLNCPDADGKPVKPIRQDID